MTVNVVYDTQEAVDKVVAARSMPVYAVDVITKWAESPTN
jgi:hypothetical protein